MAKREQVDETQATDEGGGNGEPPKAVGSMYFDSPSSLDFISSGCMLLNCVLGGGYPLGRISNVVGDNSTGKTGLAIEACANFARKFENGEIRYNEAEAAFDPGYAKVLGLPVERVEMVGGEGETVEELFVDLDLFLHDGKEPPKDLSTDKRPLRTTPGLYIVDSLDALSDGAELGNEFGEGTYGTQKAKLMSQLFRRIVRKVERAQVHLMIVSQTRDKINARFGETKTRAGGKALDFYASQILWLAHLGKETATRGGIKRPIADNIKAKCKKNKIGMPFRECEFSIVYGYGIDDVTAAWNWLKEAKATDKAPVALEDALYDKEARKKLNKYLKQVWKDVERKFLPDRRKYE